jgi:hypothetical protein
MDVIYRTTGAIDTLNSIDCKCGRFCVTTFVNEPLLAKVIPIGHYLPVTC